MKNNKIKYIEKYNKENYKMYQFRVKNSNEEMIKHLNKIDNKTEYITDLIYKDINKMGIYTLKELKSIIKPVLHKHNINEIYIFGSYARGEAKTNSDVDIYCEKGNIRSLLDEVSLVRELEEALNKKVDLIFTTSKMDDYFKENIMEDMIKLC